MADTEETKNMDIIRSSFFIFPYLAILANILVVFLVLTSKRLRTFVNGFLVSLAFSDIFISICTAIFMSSDWQIREYSKVEGTWYKFLLSSATVSELLNLCALTYERYLAVVKPFQYKLRIAKYFPVVIPFVWLSSFLVGLLAFLGFTELSESQKRFIFLPVMVIFVVIPLLIIIICYCCITASLVKQRRRVVHSFGMVHERVVDRQRKRREVKLVKMFAVVASLYIITTIPALLNESFTSEVKQYSVPGTKICYCLLVSFAGVVLSSLANPFIYTFTREEFRQRIKTVFTSVFSKCFTKKASQPRRKPDAVPSLKTETEKPMPFCVHTQVP